MKRKGLFALFLTGFVLFLFSCTKLNTPTELGDELLPAVDNVNTFDTTLEVQTSYHPFNDSTLHFINENMALGKLNDPVFGTTMADMFFNLSSATYGTSPFTAPDSVIGIDSVVLQLAYAGSYGDTSQTTQLNVEVAEIQKDNGFVDTMPYRYDQPAFSTGPGLGSKSFTIPSLKDTLKLVRKGDTTKISNVLRIPLNNSFGQYLSTLNYDTAGVGSIKRDSLFRTVFRGLAVRTTNVSGPGALAYFNVFTPGTQLAVYFRVTKNGVKDTASALFIHSTYSQANSIRRNPGGEYLANLNVPTPGQLYIQSSPQGSYAKIYIPGLSTFPNKVIHRAELITYNVPSTLDNIFSPPSRLFLDHKGQSDTAAFLFDDDIQAGSDGTFNLGLFGGNLRSDKSYRFTLTRYIQGIVTRKEPNDSLRLYAPLRTGLYAKLYGRRVTIPVLGVIAAGRVVVAGATYSDPSRRMRMRIVYSNL